MASESEDYSEHIVTVRSRGPPPPVPPGPPSVGRVLALKYYKKVSKSLAKGFKRPITSTSSSSGSTNSSLAYSQDVKIQIKIPPTETNLDEIEIEMESHYDHPRKPEPSSNICTAISDIFDNNDTSAFYENMDFDTEEKSVQVQKSVELELKSENKNDEVIDAKHEKPDGLESEIPENPEEPESDAEEDDDSDKWDISGSGSGGGGNGDCSCENSKSSESSSSISTNATNNIQVVKSTLPVQCPPPVPKFPSSTESSAEDTSFASATSGDGDVLSSDVTCSSKEEHDEVLDKDEEKDESNKIPEDNNDTDKKDDDGTELDEDLSANKTEEYEDLVQAVTQTLTLTLNNASNSLIVSLPSSTADDKNNNYKRPETGPGNEELAIVDDETEHEYQNVFIINRKMSKSQSLPEESLLEKKGSPRVRSVILSESGVTTIDHNNDEHPHEGGYDDDGSVPVVHAVINLPPRMMNLIKQRRRKTSGDLSYQKASRLSRLMVADFKAAGIDRPEGCGKSDGNSIDSTKSIAGKARCRLSSKMSTNVEKVGKSVSTMKRKVGSWYQRRVKTPVEQFSSDMGLDGIKFPGGSNSNSKSKVNEDSLSNGGNNRPRSRAKSVVFSEHENSNLEDESDYSVIAGDLSISTDLVYEDEKEDCRQGKRGQNEFEDLRRLVKQGGDFCKDLSAVLHERSELESQYAKGLSKLSAKLLKASKEATGSVAHAWQAVAVQIDTQAELHRLFSTALTEELARPLRTSTDTQHKIRKSVEVLVEKTTRNLADWRLAESKAKRQCFSSSKEFEKIQESTVTILGNNNGINQNNTNSNNGLNNANNSNSNSTSVLSEVRSRSRLLSVPPLDKDPMKLEAKRRKAEEAVRRADIEYYTFCVRSERARLEWEGAIRNGSTCLRTLEEEKLSLLRDLASKYFQSLNEFAPKLVLSVESLEEPVKACSVGQDMHSIVDIRRHVGAEQLLPDFYAEDTSNLMKRERRHEALQKFLYLIKQDLEREKKGATGVETLAKAIADGPKIVDNTHHDISDKLYYMRSMLLYLEASKCKVDNTIADVEGRQRSNNPITQYMRHQRDKQGFPQTILKIPSWARDDCLVYTNGGGSAGSSSPDWHDRGKADGTSCQHDTDFDEFESEGSSNENIEVYGEGEEDPKVQNKNLISVPSIGKCRAIYDYDSNLFDELTIRVGDEINIHDKQEDGWWLGELNEVIGIFPATYVEEIPLDPSPTSD